MKTKILITLLVLLIITVVGYVTLIHFIVEDFSDGLVEKGEELVETSLGDEFLLNYSSSNFPKLLTRVIIFDESNNSRLGRYLIRDYYTKPNFTTLIDSENLRVYEVDLLLIYRVNNRVFKGVEIGLINDEQYADDHADLITVSKALAAKNEWKWIKALGNLLINAGDVEMKNTLQRYASNQFTQEELELNKNSEITKEEMQSYAQQVLEQDE